MTRPEVGSPPHKSARLLEQIAETMREIIWVSDESGRKLYYINPAYERIVGRPLDEVYRNPQSWNDAVHPDDREHVRVFGEVKPEGDSAEFRIIRSDGHTRWIWLHRAPIEDDAGAGVVGVAEDVTERKRVERGLMKSLSLLRATLDSTADGILVIDRRGRVRGFNRRFLDLWRIPDFIATCGDDAELLDYVMAQLIDPDGFLGQVRHLYEEPSAESVTVLNFRDGRVFERYSRPQRLASKIVGRVWSFRDVTAREKARAALRRRTRRLDMQTQILLDLARRRHSHRATLADALPAITEAAADLVDTERVSIWVLDAEHSRIRMADLFERSWRRHGAGRELDRATYPMYFKALERARTIAAEDARTDPRTREFTEGYLEPFGITSMMDAPLRTGGELRGVVCFEHTGAPRRWTAEDRTFAGSVADLVSLSIEAAEHQRAEDGLRLLLEASRVLASSLDYACTLNELARAVVPTLADWCMVTVIEDGQLRRVAMAHVDPEKERIIEELERDYPSTGPESPAARVTRSGHAELIPEVTDEWLGEHAVDARHRQLIQDAGLRSLMVVPLVARGATLGAMMFGSGSRTQDAQDLALASDVASRSGIAIENSRLHAGVIAADRAKTNFLAVISHELRTPLTGIIGHASLMSEGIPDPVSPAQAEHLAAIQASALDLTRMIGEILEFSQLETGQSMARFAEVEIGEILADMSAGAGETARKQGLTFTVRGPDAPARIRTDPDKVRHILSDLLANAFKFTAKGSVTLDAELEDGVARFRVSDTGIGVSSEFQEKIFTPFFQIGDPLTREKGGAGIGLAVARGLARRLGGDVTLSSVPGKGSTFTFTLPDRGRT